MDKDLLLKPRLPEADVTIPGVGTVRVRALTRGEVMLVRKATDDEHMDGPRLLMLERKLLAKAMVDPPLTEAEVGRWQEASPASELEPVIQVVQRLSGMGDDSPKQAYQEFDADEGAEFRVLPGERTVDDGGPAAGRDGQ